MPNATGFSERFAELAPFLDERQRRIAVAIEARAMGTGGISAVSRATGVSRKAIALGLVELSDPTSASSTRVRRKGGGRKPITTTDPGIAEALDRLVDPVTRGDPESPLRWTSKSLRHIAEELTAQGHEISHQSVAELLEDRGYSLQANRKTTEGSGHPDRDDQFQYIGKLARAQVEAGEPLVSVDAKKKELVGDFKNGGRELQPVLTPEKVRVHDFLDPQLGKVTPYGVYDIGRNEGWVNVGTDHDTAAFAVASLSGWWLTMGRDTYPHATSLMITADGGGSNGSRLRLWKTELQAFANQIGVPITVCHLPPGTSKWNKIEHRLFSFITQNWRGKPLVSHEVILSLIGATKTRTGLTVRATLDARPYPVGVTPTQKEYAAVRIARHEFHGEWNYTIHPETGDVDTFIS